MGELVAIVDESARPAGPGLYYVLIAAITLDPAAAAAAARESLAGRANPFHWAKEGPARRDAMIDTVVASCAAATVRWESVGRRSQLQARARLLRGIAEWSQTQGVTHLVLEASDETINRRDRSVLAEHARLIVDAPPYHYDHRSKAEPLLWMADAIAGAASDHFTGRSSTHYEKLVAARLLHE